jgi:hypothetical protein
VNKFSAWKLYFESSLEWFKGLVSGHEQEFPSILWEWKSWRPNCEGPLKGVLNFIFWSSWVYKVIVMIIKHPLHLTRDLTIQAWEKLSEEIQAYIEHSHTHSLTHRHTTRLTVSENEKNAYHSWPILSCWFEGNEGIAYLMSQFRVGSLRQTVLKMTTVLSYEEGC